MTALHCNGSSGHVKYFLMYSVMMYLVLLTLNTRYYNQSMVLLNAGKSQSKYVNRTKVDMVLRFKVRCSFCSVSRLT